MSSKKIKLSLLSNFFIRFISWIVIFSLIGVFVFIFVKSIPGFQKYGFGNVFLTLDFNIFDNNNLSAGIWFPLFVTIIISVFALLIATPLGVKTAVFLKFRVHKKFSKLLRIIINLLSGIPSVIYGIFALSSISKIVGFIFNIPANGTIISGFIMLSLMILPTIIAFSYTALDNVESELLYNPISLGTEKTRSIYKIFKKKARPGIAVAVVIAFGRAIGETMALNMVLSQINYHAVADNGLLSILSSGLKPLGAVIADFFYGDSVSEATRSVFYGFGICLFVIVVVINSCIYRFFSREKNYDVLWVNKFSFWCNKVIFFVPIFFSSLFKKIKNMRSGIIDVNDHYQLDNFVHIKMQKNKLISIYSTYKMFLEWLCFLFTLSFVFWIFGYVFVEGFLASVSDVSTINSFEMNSTGRAFVNTIVIILITMVICFPFALIFSIFLTQFLKRSRVKKFLLFFVDSLSGTPTILFGLFGLAFFIQLLGLTDSGSTGNSMLAGALTMVIVILPSYVRSLQQSFDLVDPLIIINSFALGNTKLQTIVKILIPASFKGILTSSVLSISRIMSETAPLYLTSGLSSSRHLNLLRSGQTLTTRIYAQLYEIDQNLARSVQYESAFLSMILILFLVILSELLIPWLFYKKSEIKNWFRKVNDWFLYGRMVKVK